MKAWRVKDLGEPRDVLHLDDVPTPTPGPGQLLVKVRAAPANFPDVLMCRGIYQVKPELPFTPGVELCGDVVEVAPDVDTHAVGDRVVGNSAPPFGGFAEYALMDAFAAYPAPPSLDDAEAASLTIGYQTSWFALHRRAHVQSGDVVLVHAATGGVGSTAVELAKAAGATVIGVVGGPEKTEHCRRLGADVVVDRHTEDFVAVVKEVTDGRGADIIYDPVGGDTFDRSTKCVAFEGTILVIGFAGGRISQATLNHALLKNYSIVGVHWGLYKHKNLQAVLDCHATLTRLAAEGAIKPLIGERLPFTDLADGVARLGDGTTVGRVVFEFDRDA
ncbi:zinc-binding dehydrogenase [Gordonia sp. HNM0687]|uniref:Zinc-binding dehydrogenase n=1 Tax=Gordonia mangrovi TaxID=2665643 RepID=A0A6L7GW99_9ACTN|nr:NADPH:quinone oxidoreductase family protein [Gordonia mangrovi]MXP24269.1 zinc-binding dehydrogenase [Gordonia mangrovi]UVF80658.1 NADPH:quinone oxidoreductase family protein [Gordonia mangrovi]